MSFTFSATPLWKFLSANKRLGHSQEAGAEEEVEAVRVAVRNLDQAAGVAAGLPPASRKMPNGKVQEHVAKGVKTRVRTTAWK